ncbi:hypothetical protein CDIK_3002 [Cucumispora dikerogammari]|nr:hypothetical protein CDIK_3002 [Cucumispora dikerogammari]
MLNREVKLKYEPSSTSRMIFISTPLTTAHTTVNIDYETVQTAPDDAKKRSKIIDYKDKKHAQNLIINISDPRTKTTTNYHGHQLIDDETNFIFINTGKEFKVLSVQQFYKFSLMVSTETNLEGDNEKVTGTVGQTTFLDKHLDETPETKPEFDEYNIFVEEEKRRVLQNKRRKVEFNKEIVRKIISEKSLSVQELLEEIKKNYKLDEKIKKIVQAFLKENCGLNTEKKLVLNEK